MGGRLTAVARAVRVAVALLAVLATCHDSVAGVIWSRAAGGLVFVIAVDPSWPGRVYAGTANGGIFGSTDRARTWHRVGRSRRLERIRALAIDGAGTVFAGDAEGRLLEGLHRGTRWRVVAVGEGAREITSLAIDRRTRPPTLYAGTSAGEVRRSADGGKTWTGSAAGLEGQAVLNLTVDRRRRRGVVWAGTAAGIFRSADAGVNWKKINPISARELVVDPTRRRTLFVANEGVFRSTDGGTTWRRLAPIRYALSLAVDSSRRPGTVYVGTSYTSVQKSENGGDTWTPAAEGLPRLGEVLELAIDTRTRPRTLYASTSNAGVYRSTDEGAHWLVDEDPAH